MIRDMKEENYWHSHHCAVDLFLPDAASVNKEVIALSLLKSLIGLGGFIGLGSICVCKIMKYDKK